MDDYTQFLKDQMLAPSTVRNHIRNLGAYQEAGFSIDSEEDKTIEIGRASCRERVSS